MTDEELRAALAHELRAPLAALVMWERLLREHADDPELRTRALDAIHECVELQSRVIAELLDGGHPRTPEPRASPPTLAGLRVLIVDDDPFVLEALQLLLERAGAQVAVAGSAGAGWETLAHEAFDIVVSDLAMPGEPGDQLIRRIRSSTTEFHAMPAIALTARAGVAARRDVLAAGFDRFVAKPVDIDALVEAIVDITRARSGMDPYKKR